MLGRIEGEPERQVFIGVEADLRANLRRPGMAAGLDKQEWAATSTASARVTAATVRTVGARGSAATRSRNAIVGGSLLGARPGALTPRHTSRRRL